MVSFQLYFSRLSELKKDIKLFKKTTHSAVTKPLKNLLISTYLAICIDVNGIESIFDV